MPDNRGWCPNCGYIYGEEWCKECECAEGDKSSLKIPFNNPK